MSESPSQQQAGDDVEITPGEAGELTRLVDVFTRTLEATEFEARLTALEQRASQ